MEDIHIDDLLRDLEGDAQADANHASSAKIDDGLNDQYICTLEEDFDFDDLLQTLTPSTEEEPHKKEDGTTQPYGRRLTELKRLERFGWERVVDDKPSKRVRYTYVDKSSGLRETSLKRTLDAIRMAESIDLASEDTIHEIHTQTTAVAAA